jgi:phosphonate transport system substrate-binding protein
MDRLTLSTCMAQNMDSFCKDLAEYLAERLPLPVQLRIDIPWRERERRFDNGEIDLCWICGLPYVWKADRFPGKTEALVAPVMSGSRYGNKPVYFSDVVVLRESRFEKLTDLQGAAWAYNEPGSHSGYNVVRYSLAKRGFPQGFFGRVVESGAHQASLKMVLQGELDASAIDSTVLEMEMAGDPSITSQIRVIDTFGPSPIPPWLVSTKVPEDLKNNIRNLLTGMKADPVGKSILEKARFLGFVAVSDRDYDPIREMERIGAGYVLEKES